MDQGDGQNSTLKINRMLKESIKLQPSYLYIRHSNSNKKCPKLAYKLTCDDELSDIGDLNLSADFSAQACSAPSQDDFLHLARRVDKFEAELEKIKNQKEKKTSKLRPLVFLMGKLSAR